MAPSRCPSRVAGREHIRSGEFRGLTAARAGACATAHAQWAWDRGCPPRAARGGWRRSASLRSPDEAHSARCERRVTCSALV